jgi:hypothetical protein
VGLLDLCVDDMNKSGPDVNSSFHFAQTSYRALELVIAGSKLRRCIAPPSRTRLAHLLRLDQLQRVAPEANSQRCRLRDQTAARSNAERDDSVVSSFGSPTTFEKLYSWRVRMAAESSPTFSRACIVENEREPRSFQKLNMKSDELRDLAFHQTR